MQGLGGYLGGGVSRMELWGDRRRGGEARWRGCWLARPVAGGVTSVMERPVPPGRFTQNGFCKPPSGSTQSAGGRCAELLSARGKGRGARNSNSRLSRDGI